MLFNSIEFFVFFPIVALFYFLLPHKYRWLLLLVASCIFYAAFVPSYLLILFALILVDYFSAIFIERSSGRKKKGFLLLSVISTCLILFVFKYFNFFAGNVNRLAGLVHWNYSVPLLKLVLPLGLSFHTFQSLSYVIEVYRGNQKAERHLGIYSLYVMFFPQLVAGPIERPQNMLHQFHEKHSLSYPDVVAGLRQMLLGFFKKMVIADNLSLYVDHVYRDPSHSSGNMVIIAVFFFAVQIYCDFSGYSDIALGSARVMGIRLMVNFNHPFQSKSVKEFWRRWHISLSSWFNDYVFNPIVLALRDRGKAAVVIGLLLTFFLSGVWHGAGWKFIIYGMLNGLALVYEYYTRKQRKKLFSRLPQHVSNILSKIFTVGYVAFTWIFFRAADMSNVGAVIRRISFRPTTFFSDFMEMARGVHESFPGRVPVVYVMLALFIFWANEHYSYKAAAAPLTYPSARYLRWTFYYGALCCILLFGVYDTAPDFIYFQF